MRRFTSILLLLALATAGSLHLPVLQAAAWAGMLVSYSRDNSVTEAVQMTFDGEHPCPLCTSIKKQQTRAHDESISLTVPASLQLFVDTPAPWIHVLTPVARIVPPDRVRDAVCHPPETPPPIAASC